MSIKLTESLRVGDVIEATISPYTKFYNDKTGYCIMSSLVELRDGQGFERVALKNRWVFGFITVISMKDSKDSNFYIVVYGFPDIEYRIVGPQSSYWNVIT